MTLDNRDRLLSALLFILMLLLSAAFTGPGVTGTFHDDGVYVSTAKALAEGRGYSLVYFPGEPAQTKYPILFPLILAAVWRLNPQFPSNIFALQMVSVISAGLFLGACYLYLVRFSYASRVVAFCSCVICLTIPGFDFFGGQVLSEMPFALGVLCCLWCLDNYCEKTSHSRISQIVLGTALALPSMIRLIGLPIPFFAFALLYLRKLPMKFVLCTYLLATSISLLPPLIGKLAKLHDSNSGTSALQTYQDNYVEWGLRLFMRCETAVVLKNLQEILAMTTKIVFCGIAQYSVPTPIFTAIFIVIGVIPYLYIFCGRSIASLRSSSNTSSSQSPTSTEKSDSMSFRKSVPDVSSILLVLAETKALSFVMAGYILLVIAWPWPPFRFLMPVLPFLVVGFFMPLHIAIGRLTKNDFLAQFCVLLLAASVSIANVSVLTPVIRSIRTSQIPTIMLTRNQPHWSSYAEVLDWIKQNTEEGDTLCSTYDSLTFLYSNRKCVRPYELNIAVGYYGQDGQLIGTVDEILAVLKRYQVRYLVVTPQPGYAEEQEAYKLAHAFQARHKDLVSTAFVSKDGRFFILRINSDLYR